ncbi:nucleoid-associated protein [Clostridium botulinum]|nr:nucleoid-associated protein [Clostridium botulinum]
MEFSSEIIIEKSIIHIVNTKKKIKKLSDYELESNDVLNDLLKKHIYTSISHDSRRFAKFNLGDNIVRDGCIKIFEKENFIEHTKQIAKNLYAAMTGTNATPANFLISSYQQNGKKALALLKLDFSNNFYTEEIEKDGKIKIEFKLKDAGFNERQKIQKCAFVYDNIITNSESEIIILDKQNKDEISDYFSNTFLKSSLMNNDKVNTKNMIDLTRDFINKKFEDIPKEQFNKVSILTKYFKEAKKFEIDDMLNLLFLDKDIKIEFKEHLKNEAVDFSFNIDRTSADKRLKTRHITTSSGITLKANESLFNSENIDIGDTDEKGLVDITIKKVKIIENN